MKKINSIWETLKHKWLWYVVAIGLLMSLLFTGIATRSFGMSWFSAFLSNLLADLIAGVAIGGVVLGWWQHRNQQEEARRARKERLITYLDCLSDEIHTLSHMLSQSLKDPKDTETTYPPAYAFPTPIWNTIQQSVDLADMLPRDLFKYLVGFYSSIDTAKELARSLQILHAQGCHEQQQRWFLQSLFGFIKLAADDLNTYILPERIEAELAILREETHDSPDKEKIRRIRLATLFKQLESLEASSSPDAEVSQSSTDS